MNSKAWRIIRWILFLPIALSTFFLISFLAGPLFDHKSYGVIKWALATAVSIYISKAIAPSPRLAISVVALVIILLLPFLDFFIYPFLEAEWGLGKYADIFQSHKPHIVFTMWLVGLAFGIIFSTTKGIERTRVLYSLRWALFLPIALVAVSGAHDFVEWLDPKISLSSKLGHYYAAVPMGIQSAIFVGVSGLIVPSHRVAIILLNASVSFIGVVFGFIFMHSDLFFKYVDTAPDILESAPVTICLIAWAIGTGVGSFVALGSAKFFKKTSPAVPDSIKKKRRYKGTAPYQDLDLDRKTFFGRDHESRSLLNLVMAERLVVLFAKSGMGKSSLINTALVEQLRKRGYFPIAVRLNNQGQNPMDSLLAGVQSAAKDASVDLLSCESTSAWQLFKTAEFWSEDNDLLRPVLILDQFEEIFTLHSPAVRQDFIGQLGELVRGRSETIRSTKGDTITGQPLDDAPPPHLKILLSLREDFLANLEELAQEIPAILHNRFRLGPLSAEAARKAIIEPARLTDDIFQTDRFTYHKEAVKRIIVFLAKRRFGIEITQNDEVEPVQLQLICHYLEEMVRKKQATAKKDGEIELSEVDLGGEEQMQQIMEGFYDRTIAAVKPHHKARLVQRLCEKRLVSSGGRRLTEDHDEIKRCYKLSDKILWQLVDARLLRAESRLGSTFYELSHDRLVRPILKSRNIRLVKQKWIATMAILFVIVIGCGSGLLLMDYKKREALKEQLKFRTININSETAIRSIARLIRQYNYPTKELLEKIKNPSVVNPAALVVLAMPDQDWTGPCKDLVSKHIVKYHKVFMDSADATEAPTLLGALLFILDKLEEPLSLKNKVLNEYREMNPGQDKGAADSKSKQLSSGDTHITFVTNIEYSRFYQNHKFPSPEDDMKPVRVNWFEALAYAYYHDQELPGEEISKVKAEGCKFAMQYSDMLQKYRSTHHGEPLKWDDFLNMLMGQSGLFRPKENFCIYQDAQTK